ncbi:NUDIX hydrolase [Anaerosolibacter sp.]|uniref:NUDIX hydrolase n=1 Tax=Anaerosolibacter sp. TaxID=1872527 RepID=UPI0039EE5B7C
MKVKMLGFGNVQQEKLKYAVICTIFQGQWVFVRHKERCTWEIPGGRREPGEDINATASRELFEESGAKTFTITPICDYSVTVEMQSTYGRLFYADVEELGNLPELEIAEIMLSKELPEKLTYPEIQPILYEQVLSYLTVIKRDKQ